MNLPNTRKPMGKKDECSHKEEKDGSAIFRVTVDFARDTYEPEQPRCLQQTDEGRRLRTEGQLRRLVATHSLLCTMRIELKLWMNVRL